MPLLSDGQPVQIIILYATPPKSEYSADFIQGMLDRMGVSYYKYGKVAVAYPQKVSALGSLQQRLDKYRETSNTEYLIDAANFAMIEFMYPSLSMAHYTPTDTDGSPGRTRNDSTVARVANEFM